VASEDGPLIPDFASEDRTLDIHEGTGDWQPNAIARLVLP
jgi:hypothetical protein